MFLQAVVIKDIEGHWKRKTSNGFLWLPVYVVVVINIQFLKKRYPTKEPEERKRKKTLFCHLGTHKTEANSNPFANTISPD